jgi:hypothetical protein
MKYLKLFFCFYFFNNITVWAQSSIDHNQTLADLIQTKKWFEIEHYYQQHKDSIDNEFIKRWYLAETGSVFNRSFEAISAYEQLIDNNPLNMNVLTLISLFGQPMLQLCADVQEYTKAEKLCQKLIAFVEEDSIVDLDMCVFYIQGFTEAIERFKQFARVYPKPIITKKDEKAEEIELISNASSNGIFFNAKWNGKKLKTFFDTGAGSSYVYNRTIAEKIGIKCNETDTLIVNNGTIRAFYGVVDSLEFGNFVIKNVSVVVNIEMIDKSDSLQVRCDSIMNSMFDIVLGLPVIRQLGVIEFDFVNKIMSFPQKTKTNHNRNLYIDKSNLFVNKEICNKNFTSCFDTGGEIGLIINTDFHEKNKDCIPLSGQTKKSSAFIGSCNQPSFSHTDEYDCPQIDIKINDQIITMTNDCSVSKDKESDNKFGKDEGGFLGNAIFKYCRKATFDFVNMVFNVEK